MSAIRAIAGLCAAAVLAGCYGNKVPPPQRHALGPLGAPLPISRPVILPEGLTDLLAAYREFLVKEAHPMTPQMAKDYAEVEVMTMASDHEGREGELRAVIARRMAPHGAEIRQPGRDAYPTDPRDIQGGQR